MAVTQTQVKGLRELRTALTKTVPDRMQPRILQRALSRAARIIVNAARIIAPQLTGRLRRAIYHFRDRDSKRDFQSRLISVRTGKREQKKGRDAFYWKWVEFGRGVVEAGTSRRNRRGTLKTYRTKARVLGTPATGFFGKRVRAVPPRPFLRPAFEANKERATQAIQSELKSEIEAAAAIARATMPRK